MLQTDFLRVGDVLKDFGESLVNRYRDKLEASKASGRLMNTVKFGVKQGNGFFELSLYLEDYWKWVEMGRSPGKWPPYWAIRQWIEVKPVIPEARGLPKPPTVEQLTFLIMRKIGREGIRPKPYLQESINELLDGFYAALEKAFADDLVVSIESDLLGFPKVIG